MKVFVIVDGTASYDDIYMLCEMNKFIKLNLL